MEITGRLTADAKIITLKDERQVTNFTLVMNDRYKTKAGEKREVNTFVKCAYWVSPKVAEYLKKGSIITVYGRIGLDVYKNSEGEAKGSLIFHVNDIKFIAKAAKSAAAEVAAVTPQAAPTLKTVDDLPF
jgi:single-strand DNA-binding protein